MLKNRKKSLAILVGVLIGGTLGWFGLFEYGSWWFKKEIEFAATDLRQKGYEVSYTGVEFHGNPFSIEAIFHNPHLKDPRNLFDWQGQELKVTMRPWNWYSFGFSLPHSQKITIPQDMSSFKTLSLEGAQGTLKVTHQGILDEIFLSVNRLSFLREQQSQPVFLQAFSIKARNLAHPLVLEISLTSYVKGLEALLKKPPSAEPLTVSLEAALSGFQEKKGFPQSLAEWRDGGGVLNVNLLKLTWAPLVATGEGTLTLDKDMYPLGAFSSRIVGHQEALSHMVELGCVKKNDANIASFVLDMLSQSDGKGSQQLTIDRKSVV